MKYSISNIAWDSALDGQMYAFLKQQGIDGIEIAPTRLFANPYDNLEVAHQYAIMLKNKYGLKVSSMQSIWYGISKNIFTSEEERKFLFDYTKKAILFAGSMGIGNMVFGCPKNRNLPQGAKAEVAQEFFSQLGDFAFENGTSLSLEPNPVIYNTNFLNDTKETCEYVKAIDSKGLKVNIDFGTILYNKENPHIIKTYKSVVNHIHLSMPNLEYVENIPQHETLKKVLDKIDYQGYLSIEMKNQNDVEKVKKSIVYLREAF
ncbi:MAG: sugar phosphate isomerase/epimerase family protein [Oscillospiraceae bacterium]